MATLREPAFDAHSRAHESVLFRVDAVDMRVLFEAEGGNARPQSGTPQP